MPGPWIIVSGQTNTKCQSLTSSLFFPFERFRNHFPPTRDGLPTATTPEKKHSLQHLNLCVEPLRFGKKNEMTSALREQLTDYLKSYGFATGLSFGESWYFHGRDDLMFIMKGTRIKRLNDLWLSWDVEYFMFKTCKQLIHWIYWNTWFVFSKNVHHTTSTVLI